MGQKHKYKKEEYISFIEFCFQLSFTIICDCYIPIQTPVLTLFFVGNVI